MWYSYDPDRILTAPATPISAAWWRVHRCRWELPNPAGAPSGREALGYAISAAKGGAEWVLFDGDIPDATLVLAVEAIEALGERAWFAARLESDLESWVRWGGIRRLVSAAPLGAERVERLCGAALEASA